MSWKAAGLSHVARARRARAPRAPCRLKGNILHLLHFSCCPPPSGNVLVAAPTGVAALVVQGQTLHSKPGPGVPNGTTEKFGNMLSHDNRTVLARMQCLVIDEISMVSRAPVLYCWHPPPLLYSPILSSPLSHTHRWTPNSSTGGPRRSRPTPCSSSSAATSANCRPCQTSRAASTIPDICADAWRPRERRMRRRGRWEGGKEVRRNRSVGGRK